MPLEKRSRRRIMLASGKMVGFIPTRDYDKARVFYEGQLAFEFVSLDKFALVWEPARPVAYTKAFWRSSFT